MIRAGILVAFLGAAGMLNRASFAWPLRAAITDLHGRSIPFRAVSLGGDLIVDRSPDGMHPHPLAPGDTLAATTPATFPLDLRRGPVAFFTATHDSVQVVVGWNPFGAIRPVRAQGRRLTLRLVRDSIVIETR
jgi:hypothetical protein